jgi:hypothetical protein
MAQSAAALNWHRHVTAMQHRALRTAVVIPQKG